MRDTVLICRGKQYIRTPREEWKLTLSDAAQHITAGLSFMSGDHHLVRNFVVRELPGAGKPLSPEFIADGLNLPLDRVISILDELEQNLTFLYRSDHQNVDWAYPVTVVPTPHRIKFSTGEQLQAA